MLGGGEEGSAHNTIEGALLQGLENYHIKGILYNSSTMHWYWDNEEDSLKKLIVILRIH